MDFLLIECWNNIALLLVKLHNLHTMFLVYCCDSVHFLFLFFFSTSLPFIGNAVHALYSIVSFPKFELKLLFFCLRRCVYAVYIHCVRLFFTLYTRTAACTILCRCFVFLYIILFECRNFQKPNLLSVEAQTTINRRPKTLNGTQMRHTLCKKKKK